MHSVKLFFCAAMLTAVACQPADGETHRYLYLSSPDGAQGQNRSGNGILVFDIDNGHEFVRRIEIPSFSEGIRGLTGNAKTHRLYFSTTNHRLGCYDLEKDKVLWQRTYDVGCDRSSVPPNGEKVYVPTGWWYQGDDSGLLVIDAADGEILKRISVGPQAHNSIATLDGRYVFLGTRTTLTQFSTKDERVVQTIHPVGEQGVFPFTVDSQNHFAYVCLGAHVGFDVVNLKTGQVPHRVFAGEEKIPHRTHGVGLTPNEKELWISDQKGEKLFVFDATQMPPEPKTHVDLTAGGHGWVSFSLDGEYAWCHTPDVIDVDSKEIVATLKDENGDRVASSKFIEVHFEDGDVVEVGNEFGLGRADY